MKKKTKIKKLGIAILAEPVMKLTSIHEDMGLISGLT